MGWRVNREQLLAVRADKCGPGSGYLISESLLLTSAHVVGPVGSQVRVFRPGQEPVFDAVVAWRGTPGERDDGALAVVADRRWAPPAETAVRWGRTVTFKPRQACQMWGVPDAVQATSKGVEAAQLSGMLSPGDGLVADRYVVDLDGAAPTHPDDGVESPWGGLSGAALFCGDLLTGVVAGAVKGWGHRRLTAVPAYALSAAKGFTAVLAEHGVSVVLEPVEFQAVAEPVVATVGLVPSPAGLLVARRAVVPFHGRDDQLTQLQAWASSTGVSVSLVYGAGGHGKTRLALELCSRLRGEGWVTIWLLEDALPEHLAVVAQAARSTLVVVDYAESRTSQLAALLTALAARRGTAAVRVLLLARSHGWLAQLPTVVSAARDLIETAPVIELTCLDLNESTRRMSYRAALDAFTSALPRVAGQQAADWTGLAALLPAPDLPEPAEVLGVHMNALADLLDAAYPAPGVELKRPSRAGASEVEDRLLDHEYGYWYRTAASEALAPALTKATLKEAMAAAHLYAPVNRAQFDALLARTPGLADQPYDRRRAVRAWATTLYPPAAPGLPWEGLQPDRLVERFVGRHLAEEPELADALTRDADAPQAERLITLYARAAAHPVFSDTLDADLTALITRHPALASVAIEASYHVEHPAPLVRALERISDASTTSREELNRLDQQLTHPTHVLAEWAARLSARLVDEYRTLAVVDPDEFLPELAIHLLNTSIRLGGLRRWDKSMDAALEATSIYRQLAQSDPERFLPNLASANEYVYDSMYGLGGGWREDSAAPMHEAMTIYRTLARDHPAKYNPYLASSLNNLAIATVSRGWWMPEANVHAHAYFAEAVELQRQLAASNPDKYQLSLANCLTNFSTSLDSLERPDDALAAVTEAFAIECALARTSDDDSPELAGSLEMTGVRFAYRGQLQDALAANTEALDIFRRLAQRRPHAYLPELARCLRNRAVTMSDLGEDEQARAATDEAARITRRLAQANPAVQQADSATLL